MASNPYLNGNAANPYASFGRDYYDRVVKKRWEEEEEERRIKAEEEEIRRQQEQQGGGFDLESIAAGLWSGLADKYTRLGEGIGEVVADATGASDDINKNYQKQMDEQRDIIAKAGEKLKDPKVSEEEKKRWRKLLDSQSKDNSAFEGATARNEEVMRRTDPVQGAADVVGVGVDVLSAGQLSGLKAGSGLRTGRLARGVEDGSGVAARAGREAAYGAGLEGAYSPIRQYAEDGDITLEETLMDLGIGAALGGAGGALDARLTRGQRQANQAAEATEAAGRQFIDDRAAPEVRLLGSGEDTIRTRLQEIDELQDAVRMGTSDNTTFQDSLPNMRDLGTALSDKRVTNSPPIQERFGQLEQEVAPIQQKIDELSATRDEILDQKRYVRESKKIDRAYKEMMEQAEQLPPIRQAEFIRINEEKLAQAQANLDQQWANHDQLALGIDDEIQALEAQRYDLEAQAQLDIEDIARTEGERLAQRQEAVRDMTPDQLRDMQKEKRELQRQLESIEYSKTLESGAPVTEVARENPAVARQFTQSVDDAARDFSTVNPDKNVGILEGGFATREYVMRSAGIKTWDEKIVPGQQRRDFAIHKDTEALSELAKGIGGNKDRATKIFEALEAEDFSKLDGPERQAAQWLKDSFARLADAQGLPPEARISGYVTHLFKNAGGEKLLNAQKALREGKAPNGKPLTKAQEAKYRNIIYQSDPELLRLINKNASGKVNNRYLEKRFGAEGYETDPFQAYLVYAKKAYTKVHLEDAMTELAEQKALVSKSMAKYINDSINAIKNVPGEQKELQDRLNNTISNLTKGRLSGGSFERGTRAVTNQIYRGTLQYNFGTALTNLQQMANTFAEVPSRHFLSGANEAMGKVMKGDLTELHELGVLDGTLSEALINDPSLVRSMAGNVMKKSDKIGWAMFQRVEELNRATAYYAAKSDALARNMTEEQARQYGAKIARKTQFKFSEIDTPPALHGPIAKNFTQLLTFSVKQTEYLKKAGWDDFLVQAKNGDWKLTAAGGKRLAKLALAYTAVGGTIGQLTGVGDMDWDGIMEGDLSSFATGLTENIPFYSNIVEGSAPMSPMVQLLAGSDRGVGIANLISGKNQYGRETDRGEIGVELLAGRLPGMFIPGGTQLKKTLEGAAVADQGYSETGTWYNPDETPEMRFSVDDPYNAFKAMVFGQYNTEGGREYIRNGMERLTETETKRFKELDPMDREMYQAFFQADDAIDDKEKVNTEISKAVKDEKNINRARRLALEYNMRIDELYAPLLEEYQGMVPDELMDYIESKKFSPLEKDLARRDR